MGTKSTGRARPNRPSPPFDDVVEAIVNVVEGSLGESSSKAVSTYARVTGPMIEAALRDLLDKPLVLWSRILDMAIVEFGRTHMRQDKRGTVEDGEFRLHIQCSWRIVQSGRILAGRDDYFAPPIGADRTEEFDIRTGYRSRGDDLVDAFLDHEGPHLVTEIDASSTGDLQLSLADGCALEVWPQSVAVPEVDEEYWRFLRARPADKEDRHFVVTAAGIEEPLPRDIRTH